MNELSKRLQGLSIDQSIGMDEFIVFLPWDNLKVEKPEEMKEVSLSELSQSTLAIDQNIRLLSSLINQKFLMFLK